MIWSTQSKTPPTRDLKVPGSSPDSLQYVTDDFNWILSSLLGVRRLVVGLLTVWIRVSLKISKLQFYSKFLVRGVSVPKTRMFPSRCSRHRQGA